MEQQQLVFGAVSSVSLSILGILLAVTQLANWGLALVGVALLAITATSWLASRDAHAIDAVPAVAVGHTVGGAQ